MVDSQDTGAVELGVKFRSDVAGTVTGVRFYKAAANTGTHTGSLWSADGTRLAQATFTRESATGWQTVTFSSPGPDRGRHDLRRLLPRARRSLLAHARTGSPPASTATRCTRSPTAPARTASTPTGRATSFPTNTYNASRYGVDVTFSIPVPGPVSDVAADEAGSTSADVTWTAPTTGGGPTAYRITPYVGRDGAGADDGWRAPATKKKIVGLTSGTTYTFTVQPLNDSGGGPTSPQTNPVTPTEPIAPSAPTDVIAARGDEVGARELDAAGERRREPDHRLHGHAVRRRRGARPRAGARDRHQPDDHRPRQRHRVHVPRDRHQRRRHGPRVRPVGARHAVLHAARARHPGDRRQRRPRRGRARRPLHRRPAGHRHRRALLQVGGQHRHPQRQPVDGRRHAARAGHVQRRERDAAGRRPRSRRPWT